ncbi:N-glycosylase/DNA lyase [Candidatus Woesearchaeota archaeon]|nr:N-glycosylase/DNA lyase [Candidatus Woesearchaeota archaeon]
MRKLLASIEDLKKTSIKEVIITRTRSFKNIRTEKAIFKELCFCLLTANYSAEGGIRIQKEIGDGFITLPEAKLAQKLRSLGYRFPNVRAQFIVEARKHKDTLKRTLQSLNETEAGFKEASHFLRNIGSENLAIIDFHIVDLLEKHNLIEKPKTITKNKYLEIEDVLKKIATKTNLNLAELDLYLWFKETGKVLK